MEHLKLDVDEDQCKPPLHEGWRSFFHRHPSITTLRLDSAVMADLSSVLGPSSDTASPRKKASGSQGTYALPKLANLSFAQTRMGDQDERRLSAMLVARSNQLHTLKVVTRWNCSGTQTGALELGRSLQSHGTTIHWRI